PFAFASLPVALRTVAVPLRLKTWPPSSPQPCDCASTTLNWIVPDAPVIEPRPPNGTHGCLLASPVPLPESLPAPMSVPEPVPVAEMVATSLSTFDDAWPAYLPVNWIGFVFADTLIAATSARATTPTSAIRILLIELLLSGSPDVCVGCSREGGEAASGSRLKPSTGSYGGVDGAERGAAPGAGLSRASRAGRSRASAAARWRRRRSGR